MKVIGNIHITELAQLENLSQRITNVCRLNKLTDLDSILNYYSQHGNFRELPCGAHTNDLLVGICKKYAWVYDPEKTQPSSFLYSIDLLTKRQKKIINVLINDLFLSPRSYNVLNNYLDSVDLDSIRLHEFDDSYPLSKYRNVGRATLIEFDAFIANVKYLIEHITSIEKQDETGIEIIKKFSKDNTKLNDAFTNENDTAEAATKLPDPFMESIDLLNSRQKKILDILIGELVNKMKIRSSNALRWHLEVINISNIRSMSLTNSSEFFKYRNVGKLSMLEIDQFFSDIKNYIEHIDEYDNRYDVGNDIIKRGSPQKLSLDFVSLPIVKELHGHSGKLPIFKILNAIVDFDKLFTNRQRLIFKTALNYYNNSNKNTLRKIAEEFRTTRERIRQIRIKLSDLETVFYFLNKIGADDIFLYETDIAADYIVVDNSFASKFNEAENTNFNYVFVAKILSIILSEKYICISNEEKIEFFKKHSKNESGCAYLISKKYASNFNFSIFLKDVKIRLSEKIEKEYLIDFRSYLLGFWKAHPSELNKETIQIAEYLLLNEFNLKPDNGNVVFKRNSQVLVIEYIIEALEKNVEPMPIKELFSIINRNAVVSKSLITLRTICYNDDRVISLQKGTVVGLKKWAEGQNFKVGRIRKIVEEYLEQKSTPIHISEILQYITQYKQTSHDSIMANLKGDKKRFKLFRGSYWGLRSKKYSDEFVEKEPSKQNATELTIAD